MGSCNCSCNFFFFFFAKKSRFVCIVAGLMRFDLFEEDHGKLKCRNIFVFGSTLTYTVLFFKQVTVFFAESA